MQIDFFLCFLDSYQFLLRQNGGVNYHQFLISLTVGNLELHLCGFIIFLVSEFDYFVFSYRILLDAFKKATNMLNIHQIKLRLFDFA